MIIYYFIIKTYSKFQINNFYCLKYLLLLLLLLLLLYYYYYYFTI